jgi:signal transduction histidine kinase
MAVPMFIRDKVVGGILIMSAKAERSYSESDLKLAVELARSCATSIDNASLYREAQQSIQVRDDFILIASHELRTPLTPLKLQLQLMKRSFHPSKNQSPLNSASFEKLLTDSERQAEHLIMLVENLLDTSKISTGSLKLSLELGDLNALVSQTLHRLATDLEKSHCMLSFTSNLNAYGHWDNDRIQQVITILLLNAMKYGQGKPIEIKIFQENSNAVLTVTDHGIGIDQKDQAKLFRRFERVAPVTAFGGLGLGLFIAQQIIEKHGGKISVTSQPGLGSTFRVALPLHKKDSL